MGRVKSVLVELVTRDRSTRWAIRTGTDLGVRARRRLPRWLSLVVGVTLLSLLAVSLVVTIGLDARRGKAITLVAGALFAIGGGASAWRAIRTPRDPVTPKEP